MKKPSASLAVSTLALAVALTGTASATGLINGQSIRNHTITANKLATGAVTSRAIRTASITTTDIAAGVMADTIEAPAGPQGDPGQTVVGAPGAPGAQGTPGTNAPHAWGIVHPDGGLGDSANLTVRHIGPGVYCLSTAGYNHTNAIAVAQPWGSQLATPGYVGQGDQCNVDEFQIDVLLPSSNLADSMFSVVIA